MHLKEETDCESSAKRAHNTTRFSYLPIIAHRGRSTDARPVGRTKFCRASVSIEALFIRSALDVRDALAVVVRIRNLAEEVANAVAAALWVRPVELKALGALVQAIFVHAFAINTSIPCTSVFIVTLSVCLALHVHLRRDAEARDRATPTQRHVETHRAVHHQQHGLHGVVSRRRKVRATDQVSAGVKRRDEAAVALRIVHVHEREVAETNSHVMEVEANDTAALIIVRVRGVSIARDDENVSERHVIECGRIRSAEADTGSTECLVGRTKIGVVAGAVAWNTSRWTGGVVDHERLVDAVGEVATQRPQINVASRKRRDEVAHDIALLEIVKIDAALAAERIHLSSVAHTTRVSERENVNATRLVRAHVTILYGKRILKSDVRIDQHCAHEMIIWIHDGVE